MTWLTTDEGKPPGFVAVYLAAVNSARLALSKLEEHLKARGKRYARWTHRLVRGPLQAALESDMARKAALARFEASRPIPKR